MSIDATARQELKSFIERIERLEEERKSIADDIKDVKGEAKGRGYDVTAINTIIRLRKKDANERMEQEAILDTYMIALGMIPEPTLFDEPHDAETGELSPRLAKQIVDAVQTETGRKALAIAVDIMIDREEAEQNSPSDAPHTSVSTVTPPPVTVKEEVSDGLLQNSPAMAEDFPANTGEEATSMMSAASNDPVSRADDVSERQHSSTVELADERRQGDGQTSDASGVPDFNSEFAPATQGEAKATEPKDVSLRTGESSEGANVGGDHVTAADPVPEGAALVSITAPHKALRPHCLKPDNCGGYGSKHCYSCERASKDGEAA